MSGRHARPRHDSAGLAWQGYAPLDAPMPVRWTAAMGDIAEGLRRHRSWTYLAVESVKNQYRRTVLGPWWVTLQTAAYAVGLGVLFGAIFRQPTEDFLPYVAIGFIGYSLLAGLSKAGSGVFVNNASTLKSTRQPLSVVVFRSVAIEVLQFAHQLVIVVAFVVLGLVPLDPLSLMSLLAAGLIIANGVAVGFWLGPTVARFRDVGPFVASVLQVMIFFTPVFWRVDEIHPDSRTELVAWNPFAYLLALFRDPLLGEWPSPATWVGTATVTSVNFLLAVWVFTRTRSRLPYWVS